ncbi:ArsR/SmtB family transcription factor [Cytobacillus purgationiresistens]|uniref:DNA-binding transcriptional ArsR family regulator n=1 Tax=Cytobacillus purgationiresistens TaxID=863449 RepID=A0ABU0ANF6_9BACI|nr:metalloregulator ArsR/SmtB family transcription factor [Cytobacillus purgationiresistens]MDQ0272821.1 DNA-binding transcriptional ArsR family regulator [Cytobacillus purgationiresistens]
MVNQNEDYLNQIFHALSDPTRRTMVQLMSEKERSIKDLAEPFDMSLTAISKHIKVLERANLLERNVRGRTHFCKLKTDSLDAAKEWLRFYERFWNNRFDLLEDELLNAKKKEH